MGARTKCTVEQQVCAAGHPTFSVQGQERTWGLGRGLLWGGASMSTFSVEHWGQLQACHCVTRTQGSGRRGRPNLGHIPCDTQLAFCEQ